MGSDWIHEVKFDGYRVQLHKQDEATAVLSRNGFDFTGRYPAIARALAAIPAKSVILDGELVASSIEGIPEYYALDLRGKRLPPGRLCVWVFDVLEFNGIYLRSEPLVKRRLRLEHLMHNVDVSSPIRLSGTFDDAERLLPKLNSEIADLRVSH
jgi:bifunctional non-homologous end joining protein LigD